MEKNIYNHDFLFFVIISKIFKQKFLTPESCFLDGKKPNIAKLVDINFLVDTMKNRQDIYTLCKI